MNERLKQTMVLITEAKGGDKAALNEVCSRYINRVHRLVRFRMGVKLRAKTESMDIVQSVMARAIEDIGQFDTNSESKFINWLAKIVENTIRDKFDYFSAQKRDPSREEPLVRKTEDGEPYFNDIADNISPTVTQKVGQREKMRKLEEALDELGEKQREVVILRNYAGMTFKEIAEVLNGTEDGSRMLFVRAMDKLTDILAKKFQL